MHTPGFEFALAHHRADLRRHADDHRTAAHRATALVRPRFPGLRALVTLTGPRRWRRRSHVRPDPGPPLTRRDRALLAAARDGRCGIALTVVPDVRVDGLWFCDQPRASALVAAGLLARGREAPGGVAGTGTADRHRPGGPRGGRRVAREQKIGAGR